jgi:membrane protein YqaA with SNARE-associated domain
MSAAVPWFKRPFGWVRRMYDWTLKWAETPYGAPALFFLAVIEASFFPIPPDVLLMPLALGRPARALRYAALCTAGSVIGGVLGWYIGFGLWASLGLPAECPQFGGGAFLFDAIPGFTCDKFGLVQGYYRDNAGMALFISAFTPIPFKVFTIAAGVFHVALPVLVVASLFGRGARFFLVAGLIRAFGPRVRTFIDERFELLTVAFTVLLVGGFLVIKYVL